MDKIKTVVMRDVELSAGAIVTFFSSLIVYFVTIAPTVSYWDCGEFIACAHTLAIPHPPGSPFYLLLGKAFAMVPFHWDIAFRVNTLSVISSALTILLMYLIIIQLARSFRGYPENRMDKFIMYGSAMIGALCYAFSDTFWFNAVEAEVYALSTFATALVMWLALKWYEEREELNSLKYLMLIMYFFGLAYGVHLLSFLVAPTIALLIVFYKPKILLNWKFWSMAPAFVILGISTYALIYIRANLDPFINENDPSTLEALRYYLNREQYGNESMFLTVFDRKAPIWDYQIKYMFLRYFGWNFIGKGMTLDPARGFILENFSLNGLKGLPFLVGFFGFFYHLRKDWKKGLSLLVFFVASGLALVIYLNQPNPQPRERDYVYVGSFLAFSIWIGLGSMGILYAVKKWLAKVNMQRWGVGFAAGVLFITNPVNQFSFNFESHDRSGNYVAWDYSYNMLMSCEKDAILFTNGDNDTFPLWYLQEVEGIRKDVRIVNLSLLNTNWYIQQLKDYEPKLRLTLKDEDIAKIQPQAWNKETPINVKNPQYVYQNHFAEYGETMPDTYKENDVMKFTVNPTITVGSQTGLLVKDLMVLRIFIDNQWRRPIYFGITVAHSNFAGLRPFLRLDGLVWKLTPVNNPNLLESVLYDNLINKFQYRGLNNPDVYINFGTTRLLDNYRNGFMNLARYYYNNQQKEKVVEILDKLTEVLPDFRTTSRNANFTEQIGQLYYFAGREEELKNRYIELLNWDPPVSKENALRYAGTLFSAFQDSASAQTGYEKLWKENPGDKQVFSTLITFYEATKQYKEAVAKLENWMQENPKDTAAQNKLKQLKDSLETGTTGK